MPEFKAEDVHNQEYQERRRIDGHNIALRHPVQHASENKEHGKEHRIARGFVAYLLCRLAFAFRQRKSIINAPASSGVWNTLYKTADWHL